jgi:hypothetical protein
LYCRVRALVDAEPRGVIGVRPRLAPVLLVASCLSVLVTCAASQLVYGRFAAGLEVESANSSQLLIVACLLSALAALATLLATRRGTGLGSSLGWLLLVAGSVLPVYAVLTLLSPVHAADLTPPSVYISPWGARCLQIGGLVGALGLAGFTLALRGSVPVASRARAAALGAAAGAWAGLSVFVFCPSSDQLHLLAAHVLPIAGFTLFAGLALPRVLRV